MNVSACASLVSILLLSPTVVVAGDCPATATARPEPPSGQGLYPARLLRVDGRAADSSPRQEMFRGTQVNDGPVPTSIFSAPPADGATEMRSEVRLASGQRALRVIEQIPNDALTPLAVKDRRWAGAPRPKELVLDVVEGREYAIAARLIPDQANRTRANTHWEPVVWREQARDCR